MFTWYNRTLPKKRLNTLWGVLYRLYRSANDPGTPTDPQIRPQMIPEGNGVAKKRRNGTGVCII